MKKIFLGIIALLVLGAFLTFKPSVQKAEATGFNICHILPYLCQPSVTPTPTPEVTPTPNPCEQVEVYKTETYEENPCVTPTPTEEVTPTASPSPTPCTQNCGNPPTFPESSTKAPVCGEGETTNVVANPHVLRNGEQATVNFFITEGDSANVYYSVVGQPHWQYSVNDVKANSDNFVSVTIHGLDPKLGYDFGIQQKKGCGGGKTTAVVVDGPEDKLFQFSYWE